MHTPDPFHRLRGELHEASTHVRLAPGSELAVIRSAHRRRTRTRALVGATAAVAVGTGTVVAIQQLGKTTPGRVAVGEGEGTTPENAVPPSAPPATAADSTATTVQDASATGTVPGGMPEFDVQSAVAAPSRYAWTPTSVDAANAVMGYWAGRVPGVIISTAPGRVSDPNAQPVQQAYYTADGVTFEPLDIEIPDDLNRGSRLFAEGDAIYRVGTAPGVAADDPNPMLVEYSPDRGATWSTIELPVDTHEARSLPYVDSTDGLELVSTDAGPVVLIQRWTGLDPRGLGQVVEAPYWRETAEGVAVTDGDCMQTSTTTIVGANGERVYAPSPTEPVGDPFDTCPSTLYTWDELGVPEQSRPYLTANRAQTTRLFRIVDGAPVELALPEGAANLSHTGEGAFVAYGDGGQTATAYRLGADLQWQRQDVPPAVAWSGVVTVASDTHRFATVGTPAGQSVLGASDGGEWTYTSIDPLLGEFQQSQLASQAVTPDGLAQALSVRTDLAAERGGISIESGLVTITQAATGAPVVLTDTATGAPITGWTEHWGGSPPATSPAATAPGGAVGSVPMSEQFVDFVAADGTVLATLTLEEYNAFNVYDESPEWALATTADGVNVAVESVAELLGVADRDIVGVRVNAVGRQLVVTAVMAEQAAPGVHVQRVLVGTPNE